MWRKKISSPYPAANKQLQCRLEKFVSLGSGSFFPFIASRVSGIPDGESVMMFGNVNSKRVYSLEQKNNDVHLMMRVDDGSEERSLCLSYNNSEYIAVSL